MPARLPFRVRSRVRDMGQSIAMRAQTMVREAAEPVSPGSTIKAQMRSAARALRYPDGHWRIRAAWNGEAGCWLAVAFDELCERYRGWKERQEARLRAKEQTLAALYESIATRLGCEDAEFHQRSIAELLDVARSLRGTDSSIFVTKSTSASILSVRSSNPRLVNVL